MTDINEAIERRKILKGMRDLNKKCHCGKMRTSHTIREANECKRISRTETVGSIMTSKDISEMEQSRI